jgi:hypothetical protein
MNTLFYVCSTVLVLSSALILYYDLRERQIALWILLLFGADAIASVILFRSFSTLLYNLLGTLIYLGFIWLMLKAYLFVKHKKNTVILDEQLGKADVLVILFIGLTFNLPGMILFFCLGFVSSLLIFMAFQFIKSDALKTIPLAGLLVFFYLAALTILNLIPLEFIECSFVKP